MCEEVPWVGVCGVRIIWCGYIVLVLRRLVVEDYDLVDVKNGQSAGNVAGEVGFLVMGLCAEIKLELGTKELLRLTWRLCYLVKRRLRSTIFLHWARRGH
jgi:hypothetical protein